MVRTPLVIALSYGLVICPVALGQKKPDTEGRIICPPIRAKVIKMIRPSYPEEAKQAHIQGTVSLRCLIGRDGSVEKMEVEKGHALLVPPATKAVSQWRFKPLLLNGEAVEVENTINIIFQLQKNKKKR